MLTGTGGQALTVSFWGTRFDSQQLTALPSASGCVRPRESEAGDGAEGQATSFPTQHLWGDGGSVCQRKVRAPGSGPLCVSLNHNCLLLLPY